MLTKTQIKLINYTANYLTGKSILVRQREPATARTWGEAHRAEGGQLIIDLSPRIPDDKRLFIALHEIAHHKRHNFLETKVYKANPGTLERSAQTRGEVYRENTADDLAAIWQAWGSKHANPEIYKIAPLEAVLIALLDYPEEGNK